MKGAVRRNSASSLANAPTTSSCNNESSLEGSPEARCRPIRYCASARSMAQMRCRSEAQSQPPRDPAPQAAFDRVPPNQSRGDTVTWSSRVGMIALLESSLFKHRLSTDRDRSASQLCRKAEVRVVAPSREHVVAKDN